MDFIGRAHVLLMLTCFVPIPALAQGISARFGNDVAVIDRDVIVRIEVIDPLAAVHSVKIDLRSDASSEWLTATASTAEPSRSSQWWRARFSSKDVWSKAPRRLQTRARLYGARGGLVLTVGEQTPLTIDVVTAEEDRRRSNVLQKRSDEAAFSGYLGLEGRANSSARARVYLGFGGPLVPGTELIGAVSLGPAFARPSATAGGGPIVLGAGLEGRVYTQPLSERGSSLFAGPFAAIDARFGGLDVGGGMRAGATWI
ncbi:MAG: hypothetical protein AAFV29_02425, partial [Myxococcota bacterium]